MHKRRQSRREKFQCSLRRIGSNW